MCVCEIRGTFFGKRSCSISTSNFDDVGVGVCVCADSRLFERSKCDRIDSIRLDVSL